MKRLVLTVLLALVPLSTAAAKGVKIDIPRDVRAKISTYVVQNTKPVAFKVRTGKGKKIESDVQLSDVPKDWGDRVAQYKYVYANDSWGPRVLFVNPSSREVVNVIKVDR